MEPFGNECTIIFSLNDAVNSGINLIRILGEVTDVFVLLVRNVQMERWHMSMCATVSAVAWHARPKQLRHDLIPIRQSQEQCSKYLVH